MASFHPRELHSLVGEVGPHTTQNSTCHVVINATHIKKARAGREWFRWGMEEEESCGGRIPACLHRKC